jgi:hypothetical protein
MKIEENRKERRMNKGGKNGKVIEMKRREIWQC